MAHSCACFGSFGFGGLVGFPPFGVGLDRRGDLFLFRLDAFLFGVGPFFELGPAVGGCLCRNVATVGVFLRRFGFGVGHRGVRRRLWRVRFTSSMVPGPVLGWCAVRG